MSQLIRKIAVICFTVATFFVAACSRNDPAAEQARIDAEVAAQLGTAKNLLFNGNTDQAMRVLEALDTDYPNRPDVLEQLAFASNDLPDHAMAGIYFDRVHELDPTRSDIALFAAEAHSQAGDWAAAADAYAKYLEDEPLDSGAWKRLAQAQRKAGRLQPSLDAWLRAFKAGKTKPNVTEAVELGNLYFELGNQAQANNWWEIALKLPDKDNAHTTALIGQLRLALAREDWTEAELIVALLDDTAPNALESNGLGGVRQQLADLRETTRIEIPTTTAATELGNATDTTGPAKLAVIEEEAVVEADDTGTITVDATGDIITIADEADTDTAAITVTEEVITVDETTEAPAEVTVTMTETETIFTPGVTTTVTKLSIIETEEDDIPPTPLADTETELPEPEPEPEPPVEPTLLELGTAALEDQEYPEAIRFLQLSLANEDPNNAMAFYDLSRAYYGIGQWQQAELYASEALRRQPDNLFFMVQYLRVIQKSQTRQRLMQEMVRAHEQFPNSPDIALALARGYDYIEQNPRNARIMYETFLELAPVDHPKRAEIRAYLGQ